jgi:hypothetical protein
MITNTNEFAKKIQDVCYDFINQNSVDIFKELKNNKKPLSGIFSNFQVSKITKKSWGVYVFWITQKNDINTFEDLETLWEANSKGDIIKYSTQPIKKRFPPKGGLKAGIEHCFYVGKSEDLASRIEQHINQPNEKTTYGLKLSAHDKLHSVCDFEYSYCVIHKGKLKPDSQKNGFQNLLVILEKHLREYLNPLIGKQ